METIMFVLVPILFVVTVTMGVMAFAAPLPESEAEKRDASRTPALIPFAVVGLDANARNTASVDELIAACELHLQKERHAAAAFARNPSSSSLWVN